MADQTPFEDLSYLPGVITVFDTEVGFSEDARSGVKRVVLKLRSGTEELAFGFELDAARVLVRLFEESIERLEVDDA